MRVARIEDVSACYLIPARGGSKRIPNKNVQEIDGVPLIEWACTEVANVKVYCSTDSPDIADKAVGATILDRPKELAQDDTSSWDVLDYHYRRGELPHDIICLRQCTSPFLGCEAAGKAMWLCAQTNMVVTTGRHFINDISAQKTGGIYAVPKDMIISGEYRVSTNWLILGVTELEAIDIDTWDDLIRAREMWDNFKKRGGK